MGSGACWYIEYIIVISINVQPWTITIKIFYDSITLVSRLVRPTKSNFWRYTYAIFSYATKFSIKKYEICFVFFFLFCHLLRVWSSQTFYNLISFIHFFLSQIICISAAYTYSVFVAKHKTIYLHFYKSTFLMRYVTSILHYHSK